MAAGAPHDMAWDEDRPTPGPRDKANYLSFPDDGEFFLATEEALPWAACGPHDANRQVVPSVFVESIFRRAPVADPSLFRLMMFIDFCLNTTTFMCAALQLLINNGFLTTEDEDASPEGGESGRRSKVTFED